MEQARRYQQTQEYELGAIKGINDILFEEGKNTENRGDFTSYDNRTSALKNELLAMTTDQNLKDKHSIDFDFKVERGKATLQKKFYENLMDKGRTDSFELIDTYLQAYSQVHSDTFLDKIDSIIDESTLRGFWDKEYAHGLKDENRKNAKNIREMVKKQKVKDEKVAEEDLLQNQTKGEGDFLINAINGGLTSTGIIDSQASGDVSLEVAKMGQSIMLSLNNVATRKSDDKAYNKLYDEYFMLDSGDLKALRKFRIRVGGEHSRGKLTKEDTLSFMNKTINPLVDFEIKKKQKSLFESSVDLFKDWAKITSGDTSALVVPMIRELAFGLDNDTITEDNIGEKSEEILNDAKKIANPEWAKYKKDDVRKFSSGTWKVVGFKDSGEPIWEKQ